MCLCTIQTRNCVGLIQDVYQVRRKHASPRCVAHLVLAEACRIVEVRLEEDVGSTKVAAANV